MHNNNNSSSTLTNLFQNLPRERSKEVFETLFANNNVKIERIISHGEITPTDQWYNQKEDEFILLLSGNATLMYKDNHTVSLSSGDTLYIPAHQEHRVSYTDTNIETIWLAIFFKSENNTL